MLAIKPSLHFAHRCCPNSTAALVNHQWPILTCCFDSFDNHHLCSQIVPKLEGIALIFLVAEILHNLPESLFSGWCWCCCLYFAIIHFNWLLLFFVSFTALTVVVDAVNSCLMQIVFEIFAPRFRVLGYLSFWVSFPSQLSEEILLAWPMQISGGLNQSEISRSTSKVPKCRVHISTIGPWTL